MVDVIEKILVISIPWITQFVLLWLGATGSLFKNVLTSSSGYCVDFVRRNNRIAQGNLDCTQLYGPWASFLGVFVLTFSSISASSLITQHDIVRYLAWFFFLSVFAFFFHELKKSEDLTMNDVWGYSLMASFFSVSFSILALLTSSL